MVYLITNLYGQIKLSKIPMQMDSNNTLESAIPETVANLRPCVRCLKLNPKSNFIFSHPFTLENVWCLYSISESAAVIMGLFRFWRKTFILFQSFHKKISQDLQTSLTLHRKGKEKAKCSWVSAAF